MSDVGPVIPTLEQFPVTGEPSRVTVQAGGLMSTSGVLAGQGQQIRAISSDLAPNWNGEAANSYQGLSANVAGAFAAAALEIESAARLMLRYAADLERLQREAAAAAHQSAHWHQEIVTWTRKVNDAQNALNHAQYQLTAAQGRHAAAAQQGPRGAAAANAASTDISHWEGEVRRQRTLLTQARQQLKNAHDQFTHWQNRARLIRDQAMTAGEELGAALLVITIVAPPLAGTPDYPALEPTPGILLNDEPTQGDQGGGGEGGNGQEDGPKVVVTPGGDGEPPKLKIINPDGTTYPPDPGEIKSEKGDPRQEREIPAPSSNKGVTLSRKSLPGCCSEGS